MKSARQQTKSKPLARPVRLLIVEDSENDCALLVEDLQRHGFAPAFRRVDCASGMSEALAEQSWDLIIADHHLPSFSAPEALQILQQFHLDIPFIVLSGVIGDDAAAGVMKSGANDYIQKGQVNRLIHAVERELRESAGRSEKRRVEEELVHSQQWLSAVIEASRDGIVVFEGETLLSANPAFAHLHGYGTAREVAGLTISQVMGAEAQSCLAQFEKDWRCGKKRTTLEEFASTRADGRQIEVEASISPAIIAGTLFQVAVVRDISDRKRLETQLRQSQKMEAIGQLAGGVAHDFNNLLTAISGYCQLAMFNLNSGNPLGSELNEIQKTAKKAASLTHQLLAFSRRQPVAPKVVNLNVIVADMLKMLIRVIGEHIELETSLSENLWCVKADPGQLEQVILNLAVNARDAILSGGNLTISTANVELADEDDGIEIGEQTGRFVTLAVADNGCGMDSETQAHIFEPFFTTKEDGRGTGLGLATVYGIVEQNGGQIRVVSEPDKGTTFTIYFPAVDEKPTESVGPGAAVRHPRASETILIVEDDQTVRQVMTKLLTREGFMVLEACEGRTALELCRTHSGPIHLLITDMVMPGLNGKELALRVGQIRSEARALFISGYADSFLATQNQAGSPQRFIQKPFTPEVFISRVCEVLRQ